MSGGGGKLKSVSDGKERTIIIIVRRKKTNDGMD